MSRERLSERLEAGGDHAPVVVDVRLKYPYEHSTVRLPDAIRLDPPDFDPSSLPRDREIVVYDSDPEELVGAPRRRGAHSRGMPRQRAQGRDRRVARRQAADRRQGRPEAETADSGRTQGLTVRAATLAAAALLQLPAVASAQPPPGAPPIDQLMVSLQARYDAIGDFSADFTHSYAGGVLQATDVEHGTMHVRKPGRWRFDYTHPEIKRFVSDGRTLTSYFPADRQAILSALPPEGESSSPVSFLAGDGDLTRDFDARYADSAQPAGVLPTGAVASDDAWVVELVPRRAGADYEMLTLAIDPVSLDPSAAGGDRPAGRSFHLRLLEPAAEPRLIRYVLCIRRTARRRGGDR